MKCSLILTALAFIFSATSYAKIPEGTTVVSCNSKGAELGGFSLEIITDADANNAMTAVVLTNTVAGPMQVSLYEVTKVSTVTHGLEKIYEGPGFTLNIQVGSPTAYLLAILDHGRELRLEMNCSY